mgnify:CR=1 FL=1
MSTPTSPRSANPPLSANEVREAFRSFFSDRGHTRVDSEIGRAHV